MEVFSEGGLDLPDLACGSGDFCLPATTAPIRDILREIRNSKSKIRNWEVGFGRIYSDKVQIRDKRRLNLRHSTRPLQLRLRSAESRMRDLARTFFGRIWLDSVGGRPSRALRSLPATCSDEPAESLVSTPLVAPKFDEGWSPLRATLLPGFTLNSFLPCQRTTPPAPQSDRLDFKLKSYFCQHI